VALSILVVDDDVMFRELMARVLTDWGYVVQQAGTVQDALSRAREVQPETALVDIGLPDGDGFELTRELCALPSGPRVVLISSDADAANEPAAIIAGASGFVAKGDLAARSLRALLEPR